MDKSFYQQVIQERHNNLYRLVGLFIYHCVQEKARKSVTLPGILFKKSFTNIKSI